MLTREQFESTIKNRVGYVESDDKQEFLKGADVAVRVVMEHAESIITDLKKRIIRLESDGTDMMGELMTIARIITKYSGGE